MDSTDAHERLAVVETRVDHLENTLSEIKTALEELKPVVWKAAGGATFALILTEIVVKALH